ncbi:MAG TPA: glycosyltransferase family 39 protein [Elusimicrobiota bacterium]|jgi:hypothetical protein|nr:glycosyltransferase family 39 protein [Elusimicrobiota bacterium]
MTRRRAALLALAAALFWLCRRAYWVGFFNDDAYYLIGARSLLTGRFAQLQTPGAPALVSYLPGWPLLLAPALALARGSLAAAQAFAAGLLVAALGLLAAVIEREDGAGAADLLLAAVALSPLIASTAATLLADGPMLFCAAAALAALPRVWKRRGAPAWLAYGLALGLAALVRPTGLALAAAIALAAALEGRRREAACAFGAAAAVFAAWLWRDAAVSGSAWNYWSQARALNAASGLSLAANAAFYAREVFARALWRPPFPSRVLDGALALAGTALAALGLSGARTPSGRAAGLFAALFVLPHLAWGLQASRYMIPVVPFALWGAWRGLARLDRRAAAAGAAACVVLSALATARVADASLRPADARAVPPARTAAWLRAHAGPGDLVGARYDARWNLLTGLPSVQLAPRAPVTLFVVEDASAEIRGAGAAPADPAAAERAALSAAGARREFSDAGEKTEVWRLGKPAP